MRLIIFEEQKGKRYFDASTPESLDKACRFVLKERLEMGLYDSITPEKEKLKKDVQNLLSRKSNMVDKKYQNEIVPESFLLLLEFASMGHQGVQLESIDKAS